MLLTLLVGFSILGQLIAENDISSRIYHGTPAYKGQFPYMAQTLLAHQFTNVTHSYTFCGATLIADRWLVSAAHCAVGAVSAIITLGMLKTNNDSGTVSFTVPQSGIFIHPDYAPNKSPSPDIVLYKLPVTSKDNPFKGYPYIEPIALANTPAGAVSSYDGSLVTIIGWGQTETGQGSSDLLYATVRVMNSSECIRRFPPGATNATICTEKLYKDSGPCSGDSGGPLISNNSGVATLVGITSFGVGAPPCSDPNGGSVFTFEPYYKIWVYKTMMTN